MDSVAPLSLILVCQPELRSKLRLKAFEAVVQRIQVRYHLTGLTETEVAGYIQHHLKQVGCDRTLFGEQAAQSIAIHSRGTPRQVNNLCTACLWDACMRGQRFVEEANVQRVLAEFHDTDRPAVVTDTPAKVIAHCGQRRTGDDLVSFMEAVAAEYRNARRIIVIWDNLNIHYDGTARRFPSQEDLRQKLLTFIQRWNTAEGDVGRRPGRQRPLVDRRGLGTRYRSPFALK